LAQVEFSKDANTIASAEQIAEARTSQRVRHHAANVLAAQFIVIVARAWGAVWSQSIRTPIRHASHNGNARRHHSILCAIAYLRSEFEVIKNSFNVGLCLLVYRADSASSHAYERKLAIGAGNPLDL